MSSFKFLPIFLALAFFASAQDSGKTWPSGTDLQIDLLAREPEVTQPAFLNFDFRGRMWVAQFRQYPFPAGAKLIGRDRFWRNEYDRVPPPPGHPDYVAGEDRITIHEDVDGDGDFEKISTFQEGLNLCTSFAHDAGGLWVLQPPYLLYYRDANRDDRPDAPPTVHLRGFGIGDSHSLANSLCWGPDGWLYGANGSTTSLRITIEDNPAPAVERHGQLIWRYHPKRKLFEVFAEGGGNNWSCEFDSKGRLFSGSNNNSVAYFYHQGAYYDKNFGKHGSLSNPNTFGFLRGMKHQEYSRVTTSILIYEGAGLPERFNRNLIFANPLSLGVGTYRPTAKGLNYEVSPAGIVEVRKNDPSFCPVYIDSGPDGSLYVCDWYDQQCNHYLNSEGQMSRDDGRIYRIRNREREPIPAFDLSKADIPRLLVHLRDDNRWWRETARECLKNHSEGQLAVPTYQKWLLEETGQVALEALWGLNLAGRFSDEIFEVALRSEDPDLRRWAVRLAADERSLSPAQLAVLQESLREEIDLEVLAQVASSAARLPHSQTRPLIESLLENEAVSLDQDLTLLVWWAMERHCLGFPSDYARLFKKTRIPHPRLAAFLIRRLVQEQSSHDLRDVSDLIKLPLFSNPENREILWENLGIALQGRAFAELSDEFLESLRGHDDLPLAMQLRLGLPGALQEALSKLKNFDPASPPADSDSFCRVLEYFGENPHLEATPSLLRILATDHPQILARNLATLQSIDSPAVGSAVIASLKNFPIESRQAARVLLLARSSWTTLWLDSALIDPALKATLDAESKSHILARKSEGHRKKLSQLFPDEIAAARDEDAEILRLQLLLKENRSPNLKKGYQIFTSRCAACHVLHGEGGQIGPSLTTYQRDNLATLLLAIVKPGAEIREGFENYVLETKDKRTLVGFLKSEDEYTVILQPAGGTPLTIPRTQISTMKQAPNSLMPAGLLDSLSEQEIIDLFAYLQKRQPLSMPKF